MNRLSLYFLLLFVSCNNSLLSKKKVEHPNYSLHTPSIWVTEYENDSIFLSYNPEDKHDMFSFQRRKLYYDTLDVGLYLYDHYDEFRLLVDDSPSHYFKLVNEHNDKEYFSIIGYKERNNEKYMNYNLLCFDKEYIYCRSFIEF